MLLTKLIFSLGVMVVGMAIVFVGLVILIMCINAMSLVMGAGKKNNGQSNGTGVKEIKPVAVESAPVNVAQPSQADDAELIAVITAAIMAMEGGCGNLVVRSVRRSGTNAWARAGRAELLAR